MNCCPNLNPNRNPVLGSWSRSAHNPIRIMPSREYKKMIPWIFEWITPIKPTSPFAAGALRDRGLAQS